MPEITNAGKAAYPGIITGSAAFFMKFITIKENRVVEGLSYSLTRASEAWLWVGILFILILTFILCRRSSLSRPGIERILSISGILIMTLTLMALKNSSVYFDMNRFPYGRISLSSGAWLLFLSSYLLINAGEKRPGKADRILFFLPWVIIGIFLLSGSLSNLGIFREFANEKDRFFAELIRHLFISLRSVSQALIIGFPLGIMAWKKKKTTSSVFALINSLQTIPSLALFGILIPPLAWLSFRFPGLRELGFKGVGQTPAIIALTLYALLPIVRNTYTSLSVIENRLLEAGRGMGMTPSQLFFKLELPIGLPIILSGVRVAMVQTTGNTTVAALIGAGGLGFFVFRGLEQAAPDLILMGVIPIILLVTALDKVTGLLIRIITPKGLEALYDTV